MEVSLKDGRLCILNSDGTVFSEDTGTGIGYNGTAGNYCRDYPAGEWKLETAGDKLKAVNDGSVIYFEKQGDGLFITAEYKNNSEDINFADDFVALYFERSLLTKKLLGSTIWGANGNRTNEMQTWMQTRSPVYGEKNECSDFVAFEDESGKKYIVGFASEKSYFGNVEYVNGSHLSLKQFPEFYPLPKGGTIKSDLIYIKPVSDIVRELPDFIKTVAEKQTAACGITLPEKFTIPTGYCTWYYYYSNITGKKVLDSLEAIKANRDRIPVKYYQIDDGWFDYWGNWNANGKFPEGMKFYADKIKEAGLIPGLWIAPFGASDKSEIYKNHPEYFIRDRDVREGSDGRHQGDWGYYDLDYSVPGVCEYVASVIKRITYDWGFSYLKLDIITPTIGPYTHSQKYFTACQNLIKGLQVIRNAAKEGTFILGCTCPFVPSAGLVDGMRVSGDVGGNWGDLKDVFNHTLKRYFYHNTFFANDSDCLIIRKPENEDEDCFCHCTRNDTEIKTYVSAMAASGGALMLSDKLNLLSEEQLRMISYLFPLNTEAAVPLDLMDSEIPGILDLGTKGKIRTIIFINWWHTSHTFTLDVGRKHAFEFWSQKYDGITDGTFSTEIEPHGCKVMFFTDAGEPAVIGTDSEIVPDIEQNYDGGKLNLKFVKKGETLTVSAGSLIAEGCRAEKVSDGIYRVTQQGESLSATLSVK